MKRFWTATAATGLALSMICAPLAGAQPEQQQDKQQHGGPPPGSAPQMSNQHAPEHMAPTHVPATSQHAPEQTQHVTMQRPAPRPPVPDRHVTVVHQQTIVQAAHAWHRGDRFSNRRIVVSDWHRYPQAYAPPPGYEWVQDGNQLVLIAVASGVIATVLANVLAQ